MSMGPLGIIGSAAGSPLPQSQGAERVRNAQDTATQARQTQSTQKSESAAGIGQTEQHEHAADRDADGRRLWEDTQQQSGEGDEETTETEAADSPPRSKDTTGERGNRLDLNA